MNTGITSALHGMLPQIQIKDAVFDAHPSGDPQCYSRDEDKRSAGHEDHADVRGRGRAEEGGGGHVT